MIESEVVVTSVPCGGASAGACEEYNREISWQLTCVKDAHMEDRTNITGTLCKKPTTASPSPSPNPNPNHNPSPSLNPHITGGSRYSETHSIPLGSCTLLMMDSYGDGWQLATWCSKP